MKIAYFIKKIELASDPIIAALLSRLASSGVEVYNILEGLKEQTTMILSFGGDGTFLSAARMVCEAGVPVLGVNMGRLGFLSDNALEDVVEAIIAGDYHVESREMLKVWVEGAEIPDFFPYAINEATLRRNASGTLGVDVRIDGAELPTYWADGLLVSTSTGSTAYSLSVGGPICLPDVSAFIVAPVAPHNLNVRPLVVPHTVSIDMEARDRKHGSVVLSVDNSDYVIPSDAKIHISCAPFKLGRVVLGKSSFIDALRSKLFWGEDVRNSR